VPSGSSSTWGAGNLSADPQFLNPTQTNYHLAATSPCVDAGVNFSATISITNLQGVITNVVVQALHDLDGLPRSLDGTGEGLAVPDMGVYEFDLRTLIPTNWFHDHGLDPTDLFVPAGNPDLDGMNTYQEWVADTNPTNGLFEFRIGRCPEAARRS